jgi:hypothetical protein
MIRRNKKMFGHSGIVYHLVTQQKTWFFTQLALNSPSFGANLELQRENLPPSDNRP